MPVVQTTPRRDVHKQAATARRLIASTSIAPHVLASTMQVDMAGRQVRGATATQALQVGKVQIEAGEHFFWVASRFTGRAYAVIERSGTYECSALDETVADRCIEQVQQLRFRTSFKKMVKAYAECA